MEFENSVGIKGIIVAKFWQNVKDSYEIERRFEEFENVLVTLTDKRSTIRFVYYKSRSGLAVRLLSDNDRCIATTWSKSDSIGGLAEGNFGLSKFKQCLKMFDIALETGDVEIDAMKSPYLPNQFVPLTETEEKFVSLLHQGKNIPQIEEILEINENKTKRLIRSLKQKGVELLITTIQEEEERQAS